MTWGMGGLILVILFGIVSAIWLNRIDAKPMTVGGSTMVVQVTDRWSGTVSICGTGSCLQFYPSKSN